MTDDAPLPDVLQQVESGIGHAAMLAFAKAFGGQRVHIPFKARPNGQLVRELGHDTAEKIIALFGGGAAITVPLGPFSNGRRIRAQAIALLEQGKSVNMVVRATGMHEVNVRRLRARLRDQRQPDLFSKAD